MWIQFLLISAIIVIAVLLMRRMGGDSHLAIKRILMVLFVLAAVFSIIFPQWLNWVANLIGVGRGADLLLYALVIAFFASLYSQMKNSRANQRKLTLLARKVALLEAEERYPRED